MVLMVLSCVGIELHLKVLNLKSHKKKVLWWPLHVLCICSSTHFPVAPTTPPPAAPLVMGMLEQILLFGVILDKIS